MSQDFSWGGSLGTQSLAELSLLEANANKENLRNSAIFTEQVVSNTFPKSSQLISDLTASKLVASNEKHSCTGSVVLDDVSSSELVTGLNSRSTLALLSSDVSDTKPSVTSHLEKRISIHTPLSCSTPVADSSSDIRKACLRSIHSSKLQLENWFLPQSVVQKYAEKKITTLFPWQVECLETGSVLNGGNLIYSAPTSSGKTLVAELLILKNVFEKKKKGIPQAFQFV